MGKKYVAEFYDIKNQLYNIQIETSSGSGTETFKCGGTPLTTKMSSEGKNLYSPLKTVGATITMVTDSYHFDLYTGQAQGTKVTVKCEDKVIWVGYLTPCCYDMGFDCYLEEIELECVDGLAVLQEIPYQATDSSHDMETFLNIIVACLKQSNCYKYFYVTDNVQLSQNGTESVIERFRVSQQNFYKKKSDINQTDDDVAWSCYDVLSEIAQYMGYTFIADGEEVYLIDYDAIKAGNNKYFKYDLTQSTVSNPTSVTVKYSYAIDGDSYSESGTTVSLDNIYNKVSVKDEFYTFDDIFPEFGDENYETNITLGTTDTGMNYYIQNNTHYTNMVCDNFTRESSTGKCTNFQIFTCKGWRNRMWIVIVKFYYSPVLSFKHYEHRDSSRTDESSSCESDMAWSKIFNYHGATYYKIFKREITSSEFNSWRANYQSDWSAMSETARFDAWKTLLSAEPSNFTLEPMIVCYKECARNKIENSEVQNFPFITMKATNASALGGDGAYLIIKGSVCYHDEYCTPFPLSDAADSSKLEYEGDYKYDYEGYLLAMLKWGNQYWDGDKWTSTKSTCKLNWLPETTKNKYMYDKFYDFIDTAQSKYGCSETGIYIPIPEDTNLSGSIEFEIYCPHDMYGKSRRAAWHGYSRYYSKIIVIKNLQIQAKISNGLLDDNENDSDTVYTNVINNGSISSMDQIKFKICTFDNKNPSYSAVDYLVNGNSVYVTKTFNKANNSAESGSISSFDRLEYLTQEEHLIFKLVTQYENPRVKLECNLHNDGHKIWGTYTDKTLSGRTFVVSEIETDYRLNKQTLELVEKA